MSTLLKRSEPARRHHSLFVVSIDIFNTDTVIAPVEPSTSNPSNDPAFGNQANRMFQYVVELFPILFLVVAFTLSLLIF